MKGTSVFADRDDADLVEAARGDQPSAFGELFERWYDRCFDVAWGICRDQEAAADVAQEAFVACWERLGELRDPAAFGGWILRVTRNQALHRIERERLRRHESIDAEEPMAVPDPGAGPDARAEQAEQRRLIWTAAAVLGERDASLLNLHLRHGLAPAEIAEELGITSNNANQLLYRLRGQLRDTIGAVVLWRKGRPACDQLARLVGTRRAFDLELSTVIRRHRRLCETCTAEVARRRPELLYASVPVAIVSTAFKDQARAALAHAGVPGIAPAAVPLSVSVPPAATTPATPGAPAGPLTPVTPVTPAAPAAPVSPMAPTTGAAGPAGRALRLTRPGAQGARKVLAATGAGVLVAGLLAVVGSGLLPSGTPRDAASRRGDRAGASASAAPTTSLAASPVADGTAGGGSPSAGGGSAAASTPAGARAAASAARRTASRTSHGAGAGSAGTGPSRRPSGAAGGPANGSGGPVAGGRAASGPGGGAQGGGGPGGGVPGGGAPGGWPGTCRPGPFPVQVGTYVVGGGYVIVVRWCAGPGRWPFPPPIHHH